MLKYLAVYLSFLLSLVVIDLIWLLGIAKNLYRDEMGSLMASEPKLLAGLGFYLLYALGASIFVIIPAISKQSWLYAVQYGALFGLFCYMTYDLTNLAVIRDFPVRLAFIDIVWGSAVTAASATISYWVGTRVA
ncbi:MAG: hypothetical protein RLZZ406_1230 [Pseudomonadota bacterium]